MTSAKPSSGKTSSSIAFNEFCISQPNAITHAGLLRRSMLLHTTCNSRPNKDIPMMMPVHPPCRRADRNVRSILLLEVHFVRSPEIHRRILHQRLEFFLCAFCAPDPLAQSGDAVCAGESAVAGTNAGIALPPNRSGNAGQSKPPRFFRPTDFQPHLPRHLAKGTVDLFQLLLIQSAGPA